MRQFAQSGTHKILFCGDDDIRLAAIYLASIIFDAGYDLDYVPSALNFPYEADLNSYDLIVLSDYPRERFLDGQLYAVLRYVQEGGSLLMIGGWESFSGLNLEYTGSTLEAALPVELFKGDDRINYGQGILVLPGSDGDVLSRGLDWSAPPLIGGYNAFSPKPGNKILLKGRKLHISFDKGEICALPDENEIPLCVSGKIAKGMATALAFDLAPHWIGGMVDWGPERKHINFDGTFIEVGNYYASFVRKLLAICLRERRASEKENQ